MIQGDFQAPNWLDPQRLHHNPYPGLRLYYPSPRNVPAKLRAFIELIGERSR